MVVHYQRVLSTYSSRSRCVLGREGRSGIVCTIPGWARPSLSQHKSKPARQARQLTRAPPIPSQSAPNPQLAAVADDQDKLSDYIPQSNEVSAAPSKQVSVKGSDNEDDDEIDDDDEHKEEYDEQEYDGDGDIEMATTPGKKRALEKAAERKAASGTRRAEKQSREAGVSTALSSSCTQPSTDSPLLASSVQRAQGRPSRSQERRLDQAVRLPARPD